jgi:hypothetical protein
MARHAMLIAVSVTPARYPAAGPLFQPVAVLYSRVVTTQPTKADRLRRRTSLRKPSGRSRKTRSAPASAITWEANSRRHRRTSRALSPNASVGTTSPAASERT